MGIGRDEDTIGNVRALVPKQPQPDQEKLALCAPPANPHPLHTSRASVDARRQHMRVVSTRL